jgi:cysteinyl-tRNA synthetase
MDDDFNTPAALASLFELIDLGAAFVSSDKEEAFNYVKSKIKNFFEILGLGVKPKTTLPQGMLSLVSEMEKARAKKDFSKSDEIRQEISKKFKYVVNNTATSTTFTQIEE